MADAWNPAATRILVLGRPGSGKGTQGVRVAEQLGVPHISTGDLLRAEVEAGSSLGAVVAEHLEAGELVDDDHVGQALLRRLGEADASVGGFVLDGYPRSIAQAIALERFLAPDHFTAALELVLSEREATHRLLARFVCTDCGHSPARPRPTATEGAAARTTGVFDDSCGRCGGTLRRRSDDDVQVIRARFDEFERWTKPLLDWLDRRSLLVSVDASSAPDVVTASALDALRPRLDRFGATPLGV